MATDTTRRGELASHLETGQAEDDTPAHQSPRGPPDPWNQGQIGFAWVCPIDELFRQLNDDDAAAELFARVWDKVVEAQSEERIRLFAELIAATLRGERLVLDVAQTIFKVVAALDPLHVQVLTDIRVQQDSNVALDDGSNIIYGATPESLASTEIPGEILGLALNDLAAKQLIHDRLKGTWAGIEGRDGAWAETDLGAQILLLLGSLDDG